MKKLAKVLSLVLLTAILVSALAGCGGDKSAEQTADTAMASGTSGAREVSITYWGWMPYNEIMNSQMVPEFNKKYPNIKVEVQIMDWGAYWDKLSAEMAAGEGPDVFAMNPDNFPKFQENMAPLDELANKVIGSDWKTRFVDAFLKDAYMGGTELKMFPYSFSGQWFIYYNKTFLSELGTKAPANYDELKAMTQAIAAKDKDVLPIAFGGKEALTDAYFYTGLVNAIQPGIVQEAGKGNAKFTDEPFVKGMESFKKLFADGVLNKTVLGIDPQPGADDLFKNRKAATFLSGAWLAGGYLGGTQLGGTPIENDEIGVVAMPNINGGKNMVLGSVDFAYGINNNSKEKEAALTFAGDMVLGQPAKIFADNTMPVPAAKDIKVDMNSIKTDEAKATFGNFEKSYSEGLAGPRSTFIPAVDNKIGEVIQAVLQDKLEIKAALEQVQQAYEQNK